MSSGWNCCVPYRNIGLCYCPKSLVPCGQSLHRWHGRGRSQCSGSPPRFTKLTIVRSNPFGSHSSETAWHIPRVYEHCLCYRDITRWGTWWYHSRHFWMEMVFWDSDSSDSIISFCHRCFSSFARQQGLE